MEEQLEEQEENIRIKIFSSAPSFHWVSLFIDRNTAVYLDSFVIKYIPQEVVNKIRDRSINPNIFRIQDNDFIMYGFHCIAFIKYMLVGKTLLDYTNYFSPNDYKKNDKIIYKYFKDKYVNSRIYTEKSFRGKKSI